MLQAGQVAARHEHQQVGVARQQPCGADGRAAAQQPVQPRHARSAARTRTAAWTSPVPDIGACVRRQRRSRRRKDLGEACRQRWHRRRGRDRVIDALLHVTAYGFRQAAGRQAAGGAGGTVGIVPYRAPLRFWNPYARHRFLDAARGVGCVYVTVVLERERRVVVGVSQSLAGLAAPRYAVQEAQQRGAPLHAIRTWALPAHWHGPAVDAWRHEPRTEARRYIVETFDAAGDESDLLIVGGRGGWRRRWPSWVVRRCLGAARCPVIVVPPPELARARRRLTRRLNQDLEHLVRIR
ncbi:hypothetical protein ACQP00_29365 [Dactylosporangium sp. CS-047395]|uniref:hypothetical protein n=1 Tax=Dactylosporangium sp. CS-047395 TaxID=3239936 RepID=UPI003D904F02